MWSSYILEDKLISVKKNKNCVIYDINRWIRYRVDII